MLLNTVSKESCISVRQMHLVLFMSLAISFRKCSFNDYFVFKVLFNIFFYTFPLMVDSQECFVCA